MFFILALFLVGSASMIAMPIAHAASFHAYEMASKSKHSDGGSEDSREKNRTGFLGSAAWMQFTCYLLGVFASICFVWCGVELAAMLK